MTNSWALSIEIPKSGPVPDEIAHQLVDTANLDTNAFGAFRSGDSRIVIYFPSFREMRQLVYFIEEQRLILNER